MRGFNEFIQESVKQKLILIRGVPGSGKSTLAKKIMAKLPNTVHHEADDYFIGTDGQYNFDPNKIKDAHADCQARTNQALGDGKNVIVSNTFVKNWEMEPYFKMANHHNVDVDVKPVDGKYSNVHGVPDSIVDRMRNNFENNVGELRQKYGINGEG